MAARYPQTYRDKALAMMMASATEEGGEWKPQYRPVAEDLDCHMTTLMRWWKQRDATQDEALRSSSTRARQILRDEGAEDWVRQFFNSCKRAIVNIVDECEVGGVAGENKDGNPIFIGERVDARARAVKLSSEVAPVVMAHLNDKNDTEKGRTTDRLHLILRQARISGLLTEEDESE